MLYTTTALFQLTAPLREPTDIRRRDANIRQVSTHGSLAGADYLRAPKHVRTSRFQLTAPLREPTKTLKSYRYTEPFQLTAPLREPTAKIRIFKKHFIKRRMRFLAFQISLLLFSTISDLT